MHRYSALLLIGFTPFFSTYLFQCYLSSLDSEQEWQYSVRNLDRLFLLFPIKARCLILNRWFSWNYQSIRFQLFQDEDSVTYLLLCLTSDKADALERFIDSCPINLIQYFSLIQIINRFAIKSLIILHNLRYQMLDWIFGNSKEQKKEQKKKDQKKKEQKPQFQLSEDQKWVYDFIRQYLTSPIWRNPILDFIEQNCVVFQDSEQNKFQYTKIYQEFQGLAALLLESMIEQTGITQQTLEKCIFKGVKSQKDRKVFQQLLLCDNFLAFKKIMTTKNKELQVQALTKIQSEGSGVKGDDRIIEIDTKQLQRLQIQKAIAMSMAMQEKARAQQEKQFQEAIRMSQKVYQEEETKKIEEKKKVEEKPAQKQSALGPLPPLAIGAKKQFKPMDDLKQDEKNLRKEIEQMKKNQGEQSKQSVQERKRRLMEQRELIKKKKQEERQAQLNNFVQNKQQGVEKSEIKVSQEELTRRRNLMKKLKEQLKD